jgi:hypothetical protein
MSLQTTRYQDACNESKFSTLAYVMHPTPRISKDKPLHVESLATLEQWIQRERGTVAVLVLGDLSVPLSAAHQEAIDNCNFPVLIASDQQSQDAFGVTAGNWKLSMMHKTFTFAEHTNPPANLLSLELTSVRHRVMRGQEVL